uniref:HD domain-containing protein n=1 Tax=Kalanchoe fedtschenkoi TaxID=63787 RepID=A0A7N0UU79_KALFE
MIRSHLMSIFSSLVELKRSKSEYEDNSSKEANLVEDFDKVEMILQGLEYEKEQGELDSFFQSMADKFQIVTWKACAAEINLRRA